LVETNQQTESYLQIFYSRSKAALLTGMLVLTPLLLSVWLLFKLIAVADGIIRLLPDAWQPAAVLGFNIPGLGVLMSFLIVYFVGIAMRYYVGRQVVSFYESILERVPVISSLYQATKQLMSTIFSQQGKHFREVVLVEYPRRGILSFAFLTNEEQYLECDDLELISIFLPSTPNPTTGFYLLVPADDLRRIDITVETAFKLIMSAGIVTPNIIKKAIPFIQDNNPNEENATKESPATIT